MILAEKLKVGDTIAFFSPSSPITADSPKRFARSKVFLENKGFRLLAGDMTGRKEGTRSGSIVDRAAELNALIRNPEVKCIMSTIGGMNSNSLLPYIDYEQLKKTPKIIIGYSDITALLLGIYAQTGLIPFYGPALVASFGEMPPFVDETYAYFSQMLMEVPPLPYTLPRPALWTEERIPWEEQDRGKEARENRRLTLSPGRVTGRLIGGNLNTMQGIWGSPYMPEIWEGDILFIEDCLKDMATVERSFSLLKVNGVLDRVGGIVLGKHELFDDLGTGKKHWDFLMEVIGQPRCPILAEFDCCHTHPMLTMPLGCQAELDADAQTVTLLSPWIEG